MVAFSTLLALPIALLAGQVVAQCALPGAVNGQCVTLYNSEDCNGPVIGSYKPTCEGNCFQYDNFGSVSVAGDGTYGTDCHVYSDINCQNQIGDSGNHVIGAAQCLRLGLHAGKSMKCFFRC
jgi:hypothetical protein